jgi:hypothetical protein
MKKELKIWKLVNAVIIIMFMILFNSNLDAQLFTRKLPNKWMPKKESEKGVEWFNSKKYIMGAKYKSQILKDKGALNNTQIFYSNNAIKMLYGKLNDIITDKKEQRVNIYITAFKNTPPNCIPIPLNDKEIVLVFAPAFSNRKEMGKYFIIAKNTCYEISKDCKDTWHNYYNTVINTQADGLLSTIDKTNDNYSDNEFSDTKFVSYTFFDFSQFIDKEKRYQLRKFKEYNIIGMVVNYGAYDLNGHNGLYKGRFILQFEFVKQENRKYEVIYIDSQPNFERRKKKSEKYFKKTVWSKSAYEVWLAQTISKESGNITYVMWLKKNKEEYEAKGFNHSELCPETCN